MESGAVWVDAREKHRVLELPFKFVAEADAMAQLNDLKRIVGHSRDLLVVPFPADAPNQYRTAVYGMPLVNGLSGLRQERLQRFVFEMKIRELTA